MRGSVHRCCWTRPGFFPSSRSSSSSIGRTSSTRRSRCGANRTAASRVRSPAMALARHSPAWAACACAGLADTRMVWRRTECAPQRAACTDSFDAAPVRSWADSVRGASVFGARSPLFFDVEWSEAEGTSFLPSSAAAIPLGPEPQPRPPALAATFSGGLVCDHRAQGQAEGRLRTRARRVDGTAVVCCVLHVARCMLHGAA